MKPRPCHILPGILAMLLWVSCQKGPELIPRDEMLDICSEMLFQDQVIRQNREYRSMADSSLVYEGIFQAHGYDTDDYLYSLEYYLRDPDRMAKIMAEVSDRMNDAAGDLDDDVSLYEWRTKMMSLYSKPLSTLLPRIPSMSIPVVKDSAKSGFVFRYRQADALQLDTLVVRPR